jgi:hypothetical protein
VQYRPVQKVRCKKYVSHVSFFDQRSEALIANLSSLDNLFSGAIYGRQ